MNPHRNEIIGGVLVSKNTGTQFFKKRQANGRKFEKEY